MFSGCFSSNRLELTFVDAAIVVFSLYFVSNFGIFSLCFKKMISGQIDTMELLNPWISGWIDSIEI